MSKLFYINLIMICLFGVSVQGQSKHTNPEVTDIIQIVSGTDSPGSDEISSMYDQQVGYIIPGQPTSHPHQFRINDNRSWDNPGYARYIGSTVNTSSCYFSMPYQSLLYSEGYIYFIQKLMI